MKSLYIAAMGLGVVISGNCLAQETPPPANKPPQYTLSRWDEDYHYLRDPATMGEPRDTFDPIKYIRFNDKGDIYLSLGGQARYRYEYFHDNNFGAGPQDKNGYHLIRLLAHADLHLGDNFRLFVQGKSALIEDRDGGPRAVDGDEIDIQQAFGEFNFRFNKDKDSVMIRGGRQDLSYGAQRLIGVSDWTNVRRTFDGVRGSIAFSGQTLDLFWVRPVIVNNERLNEEDDNTNFAGVYDVISLPSVLREANTKVDLYFLWLGKDNTALGLLPPNDSDTFTVGGRLFTNPTPWDVDMEGDYQFGDSGSGNISAWSFAIEAGYTLTKNTWTPRLSLGFDIASGDGDPSDSDRGTFNPLFPSAHPFLGFIDVVGRQNIIDVHPGLMFTFGRGTTLRGDFHMFWRENDNDGLYADSGALLVGPGLSSSSQVGSEVDILFSWEIDRHLSSYVGYSHFFAGDFVQESGATSGADKDIDFVYGALMFTF